MHNYYIFHSSSITVSRPIVVLTDDKLAAFSNLKSISINNTVCRLLRRTILLHIYISLCTLIIVTK